MKHSRILLLLIFILSICFSSVALADETSISVNNSSWDGNRITYSISTNNVASGTMICALYNTDGTLAGVGTDTAAAAKSSWTVTVKTGDESGTAKIMLWDSLSGMIPVASTDGGLWTNPEPDQEPEQGSKILVAYYSATDTTERVANIIANYTDADVFEIEPVEPYTSADLNWNNSSSRVVTEHNNPDTRHVELVSTTVPNFDSYDVVFIGYPIWWGDAAWVVDDFVKLNDFTGKTVIPFCTSMSSGLGQSGTKLAAMAGTGNWLEGKRFGTSASQRTVEEWLDGLDY